MPIIDADVITFFGVHMGMKRDLNKLIKLRKSTDAIFVFQVREPPTFTQNLGNWSYNFFDVTMTYRRDSNILNTLYEIIPIKGNYNHIIAQ